MDLYDITIVGGGPAGMFACFYSGLRGLKTKLIDVLPELGGQLTALYPEKYVYDVAGLPKVLAKDLAKSLAAQAQLFKPAMALGEKVTNLAKTGETWQISTESGGMHHTRAIVLALGAGACVPRKLEIGYDRNLENNGLYYTVRNKEKFRDQRVMIVGGGDSAVDWANEFSHIAKQVWLVHRRDAFRAVQSSVDEMYHNSVEVKTFYELKQVVGDGSVEGAVIFDNRTGKEESIECDAIFLNLGFVINLDFLKTWGLKMDGNAIHVDERMETNIPGIYAAGDICTHPAKLKLIATAAGEAAIAVNFAATYLNPQAKAFSGHSSSLNLNVQ